MKEQATLEEKEGLARKQVGINRNGLISIVVSDIAEIFVV